jgi:hypothetical protein
MAARRERTPRVSSAPVVMAVTFRDRGPFPVMAWRRCHKVPFSPIGLALGGGQGGAMGAATTRRFVLAAAVLGLAIGAAGRARADLVVNGGFETGGFSLWTTTSDPPVNGFLLVSSSFVHSGSHVAEWLSTSTTFHGQIAQALVTDAGQDYTLDFFAETTTNTRSTLDVTFGGTPVIGSPLSLPVDGSYHEYTFTVHATGTLTSLSFTGATDGFILLDDVSVTPVAAAVPEPNALASAGIGVATLAGDAWRRCRRAALRPRRGRASCAPDVMIVPGAFPCAPESLRSRAGDTPGTAPGPRRGVPRGRAVHPRPARERLTTGLLWPASG